MGKISNGPYFMKQTRLLELVSLGRDLASAVNKTGSERTGLTLRLVHRGCEIVP